MKTAASLLIALLLTVVSSCITAFAPQSQAIRVVTSCTGVQGSKNKKSSSSSSWLDKLFNKPMHGSGSAGEHELDEMYQAQQQMLAIRRARFGKETMRRKYSQVGKNHIDEIALHSENPADLNKKEDDDMYLDDKAAPFKFPFGKFKP